MEEQHWTGRSNISIYQRDCLEAMKEMEDNAFDLAIVDPPYGIGIDGQKESICKNPKHNRKQHESKGWDTDIPSKEYFTELQRISKNQIIWGANYFVEHLVKGTKGWVVWDKGQHGLTMSDCELAYSSFNNPTRVYVCNRGLISQKGGSIHPTQKPFKLYEWLLMKYANEGDKILDTHLGSGSHAIACWNLNFDLTAFELDADYFKATTRRIEKHTRQIQMF